MRGDRRKRGTPRPYTGWGVVFAQAGDDALTQVQAPPARGMTGSLTPRVKAIYAVPDLGMTGVEDPGFV